MTNNLKKCSQTRCGYNQLGFGCRKCSVCGAPPNLIDESCDRCWNCEHDEGLLRWDDDNQFDESKVSEKEKQQTLLPEINAK